MDSWRLLTGECLDVLATLDPDSVDACVTDPPYGISFMGKQWDNFRRARNEADVSRDSVHGRFSACAPASASESDSLRYHAWTQQWAEAVLRVLKPGAHAVVCVSPRMAHRVTCGLEDAGFEIRESLLWLYGSGFPKSLNLPGGRGTALKPAYEPVILARKPLGGRTVAQCVAEHGTGALNIDRCRLDELITERYTPGQTTGFDNGRGYASDRDAQVPHTPINRVSGLALGRWPPNVALDEEAAAMLDAEVGELAGGGLPKRTSTGMFDKKGGYQNPGDWIKPSRGTPSRFFYCPKASRDERERGCEDLPHKTAGDATDRQDGSAGLNSPRAGASRTHGARNVHPTVKPVALMRWLVRLVTPPSGLVIDPFAGSGTTGIACVQEQMRFLGIEREAEYVQIAEARIGAAVAQFQTGGPLFAALDTPDAPSLVPAEPSTPCV